MSSSQSTAEPADLKSAASLRSSQTGAPVRRVQRRQRRAEVRRRIADLEKQQQTVHNGAPPTDDAEKRWLYSQIDALQQRIRRLEASQEASSGIDPSGPCSEDSASPANTELERLRRQMDAMSSSSSSSEDEAQLAAGADGEGPEQAPPPPQFRSHLAGMDPSDWAENPLWHSGPPSIGATDIGPMSLPANFEAQAAPRAAAAAAAAAAAVAAGRGEPPELAVSLLRLLRCEDASLATGTLLALCASPESCAALRQGGGLPLLVQLIHTPQGSPPAGSRPRPNAQVRCSAARALHSLVQGQPDDRRARREARVLRLLEQLREFTESLWQRIDEQGHGMILEDSTDQHPVPTVVALMKLSFDEEHRAAMCQLGGLYAVAELVQVDHEAHGSATAHLSCNSTRRFAGMTLTNLTFGDGTNKALLCGLRSFMRALVAQLHSPNEDLTQVTASVLRNLSWRADAASKRTLREVGAVTALMQAAIAAQRESTLRSVLSALWNLTAHCGMNKADICALDGALAFLVKTLTYESPSKTTAIVENGGGILRNISSHIASREDYRKVLREHNCLETLLQQLRSSSLTIVSNACGTLWNLSARCTEDQRTLWELGAVSMLRSLIHSRHQMIAMGSSAALKNLLSARPEGVPLPVTHSPGMPGLPARRLKALREDLDGRLTETCDNLDAASAGRPEARFLAAGPEAEATGRVPRSDSRDSVRSTLSDPGFGRRLGRGRGEGDAQLAAAVAQVAQHAGVSEVELRRLLLRPRAAGWTGSLPRVCDLPEQPELPRDAGDGDEAAVRAENGAVDLRGNEADGDAGDGNHDDSAEVQKRADAGTNDEISSERPATPACIQDSETSAMATCVAVLSSPGHCRDTSLSLVSDVQETPPVSIDLDTIQCDVTSEVRQPVVAASPGKSTPAPFDGHAPNAAAAVPESPESPSKLPSCLRQLRRVIPGQKLPTGLRTPRRSASAAAHPDRPPASPQLVRRNHSEVARPTSSGSDSPQQNSDRSQSPRKIPVPTGQQERPGARQLRKSSDQPPGAPLPQRKLLPVQRSPSLTQSALETSRSPDKIQSFQRVSRSVSERRNSSGRMGASQRSPSQPPPSPGPQRSPSHGGALPGVRKSPSHCRTPSRTQRSKTGPVMPDSSSEEDDGDVIGPARSPQHPDPSAARREAVSGLPLPRSGPGQPPASPRAERRSAGLQAATKPNGAASESRVGRPSGSRLPRPGSGLPRPQRLGSASTDGGANGKQTAAQQSWSVQQHHRRLGRQAADADDLAVEDLEAEGAGPQRGEAVSVSAKAGRVAEAGAGADQSSGAAPRTGWAARLCASVDRGLSPSSSPSSLSGRSAEAASTDDEGDRLVERCIRAALPKSRSETSCLGRQRARRTRRDPPKEDVSSDTEGEASAGSEEAPPPLPAAVVTPPPPLAAVLPAAGDSAAAARSPVRPHPQRSPARPEPADTMSSSQRVASGASAVAAALEVSRAAMANSADLTSSVELLEGVGPPSMMDSGASMNGFLSHSSHGSHGGHSNGRSPLLPRRPSNGRFVPEMMRRVLAPHGSGSMQESVEGLSSMSSCQSNIDQVKPPSFMEEMDLENSMISLESLRSETVDSRLLGDNLPLLDPPTLFHQVAEPAERRQNTLRPRLDSESVGSDTEICGQEDLPLDPPDLPLDPRSAEPSPLTRRRTPRDRRRASPQRYRTFTARSQPTTSDDASSAAETATLTPAGDTDSGLTETESVTLRASAAAPARPRGRARDDRQRYRTQTVEVGAESGLQAPSADPPSSAALSHEELRQLAAEALQRPPSHLPTPGRIGLRQLAAEAQKAIACLRTAGRGADGSALPLPEFPAVPAPLSSRLPMRQPAAVPATVRTAAPQPEPEPELQTDSKSESESEPEPEQRGTPGRSRPRIVKPGEETQPEPAEPETEPRGIRGRRKPLYSAVRVTDTGLKKRSAPAGRVPTPKTAPVKPVPAASRPSSTSVAPASRPVRGTKTTQLRQVISGGGAALPRGSRSATPSPASSATSSPQLALRRFGSAGKAGVVARELPRPASSPAANATPARAAAGRGGRRPVSVPVAAQSLKLQQRPAWVGASRPPRPVGSATVRAVATAPAAVAETVEPEQKPPPPPPLVKQGTFTLDEPSQQLANADEEQQGSEPSGAPERSGRTEQSGRAERSGRVERGGGGGQSTRVTPSSLSRPPAGGSRLPPKSQSAQPMTAPRSRIPKSPSCESSLSLRTRCSSQSPGGRRERPVSPRRGRALRPSASNSSLGGRAAAAAARGGAERSASNSSVSSAGSPGGHPQIGTGKMAALWKRIEESRAKQEVAGGGSGGGGADRRVWIRPGQQGRDANANRPAETHPGRRSLTEGASPAARMVLTQQGWRRLGPSPAQSPTEPRPNATAVIPPFNYSPPGAASAAADSGEKRKRKSAALSAT